MKTLFCTFNPRQTDSEGYYPHSSGDGGTKQYAYLYTGNREVAVGDFAAVHNGSEFAVVRIQRIKPGIDDKVIKHVLTVITQDDFKQYLLANESIVEHRKVFDQLDYMLEEEKKLSKYNDLATRSPEAAALLRKARVWEGPVIECHFTGPIYDVPTSPLEKQSTASEAVEINTGGNNGSDD